MGGLWHCCTHIMVHSWVVYDGNSEKNTWCWLTITLKIMSWSIGKMKFPICGNIIQLCSKAPTRNRWWLVVPSYDGPSKKDLRNHPKQGWFKHQITFSTLRESNMAMESTLLMADVPIETWISSGFPIEMFDRRRVSLRNDFCPRKGKIIEHFEWAEANLSPFHLGIAPFREW